MQGGRRRNLAWVGKRGVCTQARHDGAKRTPEKSPQPAKVAQALPQSQVVEAGGGDHVEYEVSGRKHEKEVGVADRLMKDVEVPEKILEKTNEENGANDGLK